MLKKFDRKSIRLKGYDYSQEGLYFITICCQDRINRFGEVVNGEMILNQPGKMIDRWIQEIPIKFTDIEVDEYVIMPNHIHIIWVNNGNGVVAVDLRVDPKKEGSGNFMGEHIGSPQPPEPQPGSPQPAQSPTQPIHKPGTSLFLVVQWFKTMTTNEYIRGVKTLGWETFRGKIWQRNYYEHIIRDDNAYHNISQYIRNNPLNWDKDKFHANTNK